MAWLAGYYLWIKAFHIMAVIAWMAGLFYLPRLFVYHSEQVERGTPPDQLFQTMEEKLLRVIMGPAMIAVWLSGVVLATIPGVIDWGALWPWAKLAGIVGMSWFHGWLSARRRDFVNGNNSLSGRRYRIMNEIPTLFMVLIVVSVVVKP